jgi:putative glutamine amidotransferase
MERRIDLYADAVRRAGGDPVLLDAASGEPERDAVLDSMDGLLLSGGADIDPARYGQQPDGARDIEPDRDALEAAAWGRAETRGLPVLGICRGFQAINVFAGGALVQHVEGHEGHAWGDGPAHRHEARLVAGSRLAGLLAPDARGDGSIEVNSYHHQAVAPDGLAPGFVASAWLDDPDLPLIEGLEAPGDRFVVGVQCHPERTESTPPAFEGLFRAFVEAARAGR